MKCFVCGKGRLQERLTQTEGEVKHEKYVVTLTALVCDACGHVALEGRHAPEYMRLLADAYRAEHGLLTSDDIRKLRTRLGMSQQKFATALGVGIASVKRWELGGIQDRGNNMLMVALAETLGIGRWSAYEFESCEREYADRDAVEVGWEGLPHGPPMVLASEAELVCL